MNKVSSRVFGGGDYGEDFLKTGGKKPTSLEVMDSKKFSAFGFLLPQGAILVLNSFFLQLTWVRLGYSHAIRSAPDSFGYYSANDC